MKNNNGLGLYEIGEHTPYPCGCIQVAEVVGYTCYVHPDCPHDNKSHTPIKNYNFKPMAELPKEGESTQ